MPSQGTPPNLPLSGGQADSAKAAKPTESAPAPKKPNIPMPVPPQPIPPITALSFTKRPGGGIDVPDPFINQAPTKPNTSPAGAPQLVSATPKTPDFLNPASKGNASSSPVNTSMVSPLAPPAFAKPTLPHRNRRVVILVGGSVVLLLIFAAIGFIAFRFFFSNNSSPVAVVTPSPTQQSSTVPSATATLSPTGSSQPAPSVNADNEISDLDKDGLTTAEERYYGTDPNNPDTDGDGYKDGDEVKAGYDPLGSGKLDSDNDGLPDPDERAFGSDPFNPDTDGDGFQDGAEIMHGHNPLIPAPNDQL